MITMKPALLHHLKTLCLLITFVCMAPVCLSAEKNEYVLQESSYRKLNDIREDIDKGNLREALGKLEKLLVDVKDQKYDTAVVLQTMGYVHYELNDAERAVAAFIKSVETGELPPDVTHELHLNIAQLAIYSDKFQTGLEYLGKWFEKEKNPKPEALLLAASAYIEMEKYRDAVPYLKRAIQSSDTPPRNWYELLLGAHLQAGQLNDAAVLLEDMIVRYPKEKEYWMQLIAVYQQLDKNRKALAVSELAYKKGLFNSEEIINLAKNYLWLEMPYKAGKLLVDELQRGRIDNNMENLKLITNSWLSAQEYDRAIEALEELIRIDNDPEHRFRLAQLLVDKGQWQAAVPHLEAVVRSTGFDQIGEAWLLLGISQYESDNRKDSLVSFNKALAHKRSQEQARWWVELIKEEMSEEGTES
ncbi:MAG: tetratricopeptide repeat protein [Gammaproteobacteria bacterium]|nr:tetratricopeptide repeat protein [Gammaproteobacteria bacterium]